MEVSSLDSLPNPPVGVSRLDSSAYGTPQPDSEDSESRVTARLENENGLDRLRHTGAGSELFITVDIRIGEESRPESSTLRSGTDDELRATVPDKGGKASAKESDESAMLDSRSIHTNVAAAWLEPESGSDRLQRTGGGSELLITGISRFIPGIEEESKRESSGSRSEVHWQLGESGGTVRHRLGCEDGDDNEAQALGSDAESDSEFPDQVLARALAFLATVEHGIAAQLAMLEPRIHAVDDECITTQVQGASSLCISIMETAVEILHRTDFAVAKPMLKGCLAPSMRPVVVITADSLWPKLSGIWIRSAGLKQFGSFLWMLGLAAFLQWFGVVSEWWIALFPALSCPGVLSFVVCFNKKVLIRILHNFQTVLLCLYTLALFGCFGVLWRNQPIKLAAFVFYMLTFLAATFIDAYPEVLSTCLFCIAGLLRIRVRTCGACVCSHAHSALPYVRASCACD
jgi:hypothetical protein